MKVQECLTPCCFLSVMPEQPNSRLKNNLLSTLDYKNRYLNQYSNKYILLGFNITPWSYFTLLWPPQHAHKVINRSQHHPLPQVWGVHRLTTPLRGGCHRLSESLSPCRRRTHTKTASSWERRRTYQGYGCPGQQWPSSRSCCGVAEAVPAARRPLPWCRSDDAAGLPKRDRQTDSRTRVSKQQIHNKAQSCFNIHTGKVLRTDPRETFYILESSEPRMSASWWR